MLLELQLMSHISSQLAADNSGFLSSYCGNLRVPLELKQVSQAFYCVAAEKSGFLSNVMGISGFLSS